MEQKLLAFLGQARRVNECGKRVGLIPHIVEMGDHLLAPEHNVETLASGQPNKSGLVENSRMTSS
ncbi:hypothetical protein HGG75_26370 [Ochrobactrum pseudogrignonense]|nr:hypothetical protein [Brucella pseudogrignonensis]